MRYLLVVIICYASTAFAQEILPPIGLRSTTIHDFDAKAIGDSVLITFMTIQQPSGAELVFRYLIKPDKTLESIGLPGTIGDIEKVEDRGDKLALICSMNDKKETVFQEIIFDKATKSLSKPNPFFRANRKYILGIVPVNGLLVLSESRKQDSLIVTQIDDSRRVNERRFFILDKMLKLRENEFLPMRSRQGNDIVPGLGAILEKQSYAIFHDGRRITPGQVVSDLKIYVDNQNIVITRDQQKRTYQQFAGFTSLINIDLRTGSMKYGIIGEPTAKTFTSVFSDGHLYRISKDKLFKIDIYQDDSLLKSLDLEKDLVYMNHGKYYKRSDVSVSEEFKCSQALLGGVPFVQPRPGSGKMFLKIGAHFAPTGNSAPMGAPLAGAPTTISTPNGPVTLPSSGGGRNVGFSSQNRKPVINELAETVGVDKYFYLSGDLQSGFEYSQGQGSLDHQIDTFEMNGEKEEGKYRMKMYLQTKNFTYAFYRQKGDKEIQVVRFRNNL